MGDCQDPCWVPAGHVTLASSPGSLPPQPSPEADQPPPPLTFPGLWLPHSHPGNTTPTTGFICSGPSPLAFPQCIPHASTGAQYSLRCHSVLSVLSSSLTTPYDGFPRVWPSFPATPSVQCRDLHAVGIWPWMHGPSGRCHPCPPGLQLSSRAASSGFQGKRLWAEPPIPAGP